MALGLPQGGLKIAGHRIPWEAVGAVAAVVGVILVIRARQQGSNVASVGNVPAAVLNSGSLASYGTGFGPDYSGALANLSQQLTSVQQGLNAPTQSTPSAVIPTPTPGPTPGPIPLPGWQSGGLLRGPIRFPNWEGGGLASGTNQPI